MYKLPAQLDDELPQYPELADEFAAAYAVNITEPEVGDNVKGSSLDKL